MEKIFNAQNKMLPLMLIIASTLINSSIFIYSSLASMFLYTLGISALMILIGISIIKKQSPANLYVTLPVLLILVWTTYVLISGTLNNTFNFTHLYYFFNGVFFLIVFKLSSGLKKQSGRLFFALGFLAFIETIVCLLQAGGFLSALNHYFTVTGTWVNPNVTAMFLAMVVPALFSLVVYNHKKWKAAIFILFLILISLVLLKCRTAIIGACLGCIIILNFRYGFIKYLRVKSNYKTRILLAVLCIIILIPVGKSFYAMKRESSEGRMLIWKLSLSMIKEKPVTGYGYGMFEKEYNLHQAKYFNNGNENTPGLKTAGHVNMAYNEFLQNAVEGGLAGFLIFLFLIVSFLILPRRETNDITYIAPYAGVAIFGIMSLVNFTIQAVPAMSLFILYGALLATHPSFKKYPIFSGNSSSLQKATKVLGLCMLIGGAYLLYNQILLTQANIQNKKAALLGRAHQFTLAEALLKPLSSTLSAYESYWKNYGEILYADQQYAAAAAMFDEAKKYSANPVIYRLSALCFEKIQQKNKALENYKQAAALEPYRIGPKYELMQWYLEAGALENAYSMAKEIIKIEPKIINSKSTYYKKQASALLQRTP